MKMYVKRKIVRSQIILDISYMTKRSAINITDYILYAYDARKLKSNKTCHPLVQFNGVYKYDPAPSDEKYKLMRNADYLEGKEKSIAVGNIIEIHGPFLNQFLNSKYTIRDLPDAVINEIVFSLFNNYFLLTEDDESYLTARVTNKYETSNISYYSKDKQHSRCFILDIEKDDEKDIDVLLYEAKQRVLDKYDSIFWTTYLFPFARI